MVQDLSEIEIKFLEVGLTSSEMFLALMWSDIVSETYVSMSFNELSSSAEVVWLWYIVNFPFLQLLIAESKYVLF